jgi:peptidoglycan-associated lipoprotein
MQLKKSFKTVALALPIVALAACSSTKTTNAGDSETDANQSAAVTQSDNSNNSSNVQVGTVQQVKSPEQIREERFAVLRQDHVLYFDFDKTSIRAEFHELLKAHADFLVKHPEQKIIVEGHCDERGTPEYNIALGERRAKVVADFLKNLGVSSSQISLVSYGEEKPQDRAKNAAAFAKNRRAVLVYN